MQQASNSQNRHGAPNDTDTSQIKRSGIEKIKSMNQSHARLQDEAQSVPLKSTAPSLTSAAKARTLSSDSPDSYHQQRHQFPKQSIPTRISHQVSNPRRTTSKPHHGLVNIPPAPPRYSRSPQRPRPGPHRMPLFPLPRPIDPLFLSFPFLSFPFQFPYISDATQRLIKSR
jgi:hypothetical protein